MKHRVTVVIGMALAAMMAQPLVVPALAVDSPLVAQGVAACKTGNYSAAIQALTQTVASRDGNTAQGHYYLGLSYNSTGAKNDVLQGFRSCLALKPAPEMERFRTRAVGSSPSSSTPGSRGSGIAADDDAGLKVNKSSLPRLMTVKDNVPSLTDIATWERPKRFQYQSQAKSRLAQAQADLQSAQRDLSDVESTLSNAMPAQKGLREPQATFDARVARLQKRAGNLLEPYKHQASVMSIRVAQLQEIAQMCDQVASANTGETDAPATLAPSQPGFPGLRDANFNLNTDLP